MAIKHSKHPQKDRFQELRPHSALHGRVGSDDPRVAPPEDHDNALDSKNTGRGWHNADPATFGGAKGDLENPLDD